MTIVLAKALPSPPPTSPFQNLTKVVKITSKAGKTFLIAMQLINTLCDSQPLLKTALTWTNSIAVYVLLKDKLPATRLRTKRLIKEGV
jgi:hypothetical protein